jgi:hypothetical protein
VTFSWSPPASGQAASYQYVVEKGYSASGPFDETITAGNTGGTSFTYNMICGSAYFYQWRVRALEADGTQGPWSIWDLFQAMQ